MFSLLSRRRLPADRRPPLERDERVLAWAHVGGGESGTLVATNRGLWLPGRDQPDQPESDQPESDQPEPPGRLGWHQIHKAVWAAGELTVISAEVIREAGDYKVVADRPALTFTLDEPGDVPHQVRARVTGSVAYTQHHRLPSGAGVRVVGRRVSGVDGLTWTVRFDPGVEMELAEAEVVAADLVARARSTADPTL